jgi:hypothetical protein
MIRLNLGMEMVIIRLCLHVYILISAQSELEAVPEESEDPPVR